MANSKINTDVSGKNVILTVRIGEGHPLNWWLSVSSKNDYGYNKGQCVGDYPWIVDIIPNGNVAVHSMLKTYKPGSYAAVLNVIGIGQADFSTFELLAPVPAPA